MKATPLQIKTCSFTSYSDLPCMSCYGLNSYCHELGLCTLLIVLGVEWVLGGEALTEHSKGVETL